MISICELGIKSKMNKEYISSPLFIKHQRAYKNNPKSSVFAPLAEGYRKAGMLEKALDILKDGMKYHPSYAMGYLCLASCYFDLSQYNLSYLTLRPLIEGNRDNIKMQRLFAQSCHKTGRLDEALETYKHLLFINPRDKDAAVHVKNLEDKELVEENLFDNSIVHHLPGTFPVEHLSDNNVDDWHQMDLGHDKEINEKEQKTISESESIPTCTLADIYCQQGHFDKAEEILKKMIPLEPEQIKKKLTEIAALKIRHAEESWNNKLVVLENKMGEFKNAIQQRALTRRHS